MSRRSPVGPVPCLRLVVATLLGAGALVGCLGTDPPMGAPASLGEGGGASSPAAENGGASPDGTSSGGTSSNDPPDASTTSDGKLPIPDAGANDTPPEPTCSVQTFTASAFNFRCSALAPTSKPGGVIPVGTYNLSRWWQSTTCDQPFRIGSATVFEQGGGLFMRFIRNHKVDGTDPGTTHTGTYRLEVGAKGSVVRTERCDAATKDTVEQGAFAYVPGAAETPDTLVFSLGDHAESWQRVD